MSQKKRRFEQFLFYDYAGIEQHLKKMAAKGWQLRKITRFCWEYEKAEPRELHYAVTYFSEASEFNPYPTDNQLAFYEYCRSAGWELVTEWAQMQIFCTEQQSPVPIETEESLKLQSMHRAMKKNLLPSTLLVALLALLQIALQLHSIRLRPLSSLSSNVTLVMLVLWTIIALQMLVSLGEYLVWYFRSKASVSTGGRCLEQSSRYRKLSSFFTITAGAAVALLLISMALQRFFFMGIVSVLGMLGVILLASKIKYALKGAGVSRRANLTATIAACVVLALLLNAGIMGLAFYGAGAGWFQDTPARQYTFTLRDGSVYTRELYSDPLPLRVEDLQQVDYPHYSYEWSGNQSVFLAHYTGRQHASPDGKFAPELDYSVTDVRFAPLFEICLQEYLDAYDYEREAARPQGRHFRQTNDPVWQADAVYQLYRGDEPQAQYLLCRGSRIIHITLNEMPSQQQMDIINQKLGGQR